MEIDSVYERCRKGMVWPGCGDDGGSVVVMSQRYSVAKATGLCVPAHGMGRNPTDVHSNVGWCLCTRCSKFPSDDLPYHNLLGMGGRFASKSGYRGSASLHPNRECSLAVLRFVLSRLDQTNT